MKEYTITDGIAEETYEFENDATAIERMRIYLDETDWSDNPHRFIDIYLEDENQNLLAVKYFEYFPRKDAWIESTQEDMEHFEWRQQVRDQLAAGKYAARQLNR